MATLPVEFHPAARAEADAAFDYYLECSPRAAEVFLGDLESARAAIEASTDTWAEYLYGTRRYLLSQFPFVVVYRVTPRRIEPIAVAHGRRRPGYWKDRL